MKSTEEILAYIRSYFAAVLERPQYHFRNADEMEYELTTIEGLRNFIIDDSAHTWPCLPRKYFDFMGERGYGALGFSYGISDEDHPKPPVKGPTDEEIDQMQKLSKLWQEYQATLD